MRFVRRAWHGLEHYRVSAVSVALGAAVVALFILSEGNSNDLRHEAAARTLQSCEASAERTHATRATFLAIFDLFDKQAQAAGQPPSQAVKALRDIVNQQLPELSCPTDQGPIVIPTPSSATVPPPPSSSDLPESAP